MNNIVRVVYKDRGHTEHESTTIFLTVASVEICPEGIYWWLQRDGLQRYLNDDDGKWIHQAYILHVPGVSRKLYIEILQVRSIQREATIRYEGREKVADGDGEVHYWREGRALDIIHMEVLDDFPRYFTERVDNE